VIEGVDFVVVRENCGGAYFGRKVEEETYGGLD
jgi:3-isopropylmalate dehydrogenase